MNSTHEQSGPPVAPTTELAVRPDPGRIAPAYGFFKTLIKMVSRVYFRLDGRGMEHVPASGPVLLLANHASFLDPPLIGSMIGREAHFLARSGIAYAPGVGWVLRTFNTHSIRREGIDRDAIKTCAAVLNAGWPLILFPEGTRSRDGRVSKPKWGFGMIIEQVGSVPCVPVYIAGSGRAWGRGVPIPLPRKVTIRYGRAFAFEPRREGEARREFYHRCADRLLAEWRALGAEEAASAAASASAE